MAEDLNMGAEWLRFAKVHVPIEASPTQRAEMEATFYSGALSFYLLAERIAREYPPDDTEQGTAMVKAMLLDLGNKALTTINRIRDIQDKSKKYD